MALTREHVQKYAQHTHHLLVIGGLTVGLVLACKMIIVGVGVLFGFFGRSDASDIATAIPIEEICNGIDDDLDGEIDEGVSVPVYTRDPVTQRMVIVYECITVSRPNASTPSPSSPGAVSIPAFLTQSTSSSVGGSLGTTEGVVAGSTTAGVDGGQGELSCGGMQGVGTSCMDGIGECRRYGSMICATDGRGLICSVVAGAPVYEICDGLDNDCDGSVDEELDVLLYADFDNDGYGDPLSVVHGCDLYLEGFVRNADDCDDTDPTRTTNCGLDGLGTTSGSTGGMDSTNGGGAVEGCVLMEGQVMPEICDGRDNDCDGIIDNGIDVVLYADFDNDGYGDPLHVIHGCDRVLEGFVDNALDCDDTDRTITRECHGNNTSTGGSGDVTLPNDTTGPTTTPTEGGKEFCNGRDDNANRQIDEGFAELGTACMVGEGACKRTGTVICSLDGIETMCSTSPGLAEFERCDGLDNDCDGEIDEGLEIILYADFDNDGYGDPLSPVYGCAVDVEGFVANNYDCDDTDAMKTLDCSVTPDDVDPNPTDSTGSNDTTGDTTVPDDTPPSTTGEQTGNTTVPTEPIEELCNDRDDDMDRLIDEDFPRKGATCVVGEGVCKRTGSMVCSSDERDVVCDVTPASPDAEICDELDNDCDGSVDEGMDVALYIDVDRDGYGSRSSILFGCASYVPGYVGNDTDCDDRDATKNVDCDSSPDSSTGAGTDSPTTGSQSGGNDTTSQPPVVVVGDEPVSSVEDDEVVIVTPGGRTSSEEEYVFDAQTVGYTEPISWEEVSPYYEKDVLDTTSFPSVPSGQGSKIVTYTPSSVAKIQNPSQNISKTTKTIYGNGTINVWTVDQLQQQNSLKAHLAELSAKKYQGGLSIRTVDERTKPTTSIMATSVLGGSMCGNGMCEMVTINGYTSLEPLCPQDCSLSCGSKSMPTDRCMQYIQKDALYVQLGDGEDLKRLRSLQNAGVMGSITKPFGYVGDSTLRVDFDAKAISQVQMVELLYKMFDTRIIIEPVPLFLIQQTSSVEESVSKKGVTMGVGKGSYDPTKQRYLRAIRIPTQTSVCVPNKKETLVAVVDNAFDTRHPALVNRVENTYDIADNDRDVLPPKLGNDWEHGTIAAGLVAGEKNDLSQMQGSDLGMAKLILVKAAKNAATNGDEVSAGIEGVVKAAELGARIVVTSWGTPIDVGPLKRVIKALSQKGVLVVAAAGNYNTSDPFYPAAYGEALAIGAVDKFMERASFSNYGTWVDLVAPGVDIFVPVPGNRYKTVDGTSEAAPLVAGVLAAAASLEVRVSSIIVPRSKIAAAVSADMEGQLGKGVIQFPADVCVETQSIKDNQNNQETEKSDDKNARDEQTPGSATQIGTSPLDILLRGTAGPSVYHGAASVGSSISSVLMGWVSGVCTILAVALGGRFWYKKKNKKTDKLE